MVAACSPTTPRTCKAASAPVGEFRTSTRHIDIVGDGNIGEELRFPPPHGRQTLKTRPAIFISPSSANR